MTAACRGYDVVVIGGGINGAGIARDAAMRGLAVLLLEQNDFGSGTSSWSSRLIHGGLRYLEHGEIPLVFESLRERRRLRRTAPHLVRPLRINIPIYEDSKRGMWLLRAGMLAYEILSPGKALPRHRIFNRQEFLANEPGVNSEGLLGGAQYSDAQAAFPERLVIENVLAAAAAGAEVRNYSPVTAIDVQERRVTGVRFRDFASGEEIAARARVVINAAGPWVDRVLARANAPFPKLMGGTKGSHIVVGCFAGAPKDAFYVEARADARPFFIIPWYGQFLIGTTDLRDDGDPGEVAASAAEMEYLLSETNRVFPGAGLGTGDIHYAYAGVRPLPFQSAGPESSITRRHIVKTHEDRARGLLSVIGGKLTTYRALSELVVDRVVAKFGLAASACATRDELLPGAADIALAHGRLRETTGVSSKGRARLLDIYGGRALRILDLMTALARPGEVPDPVNGFLAAEVALAVREEFARNLTDIVHRRTMVGLSADLGSSVAERTAAAAARELHWDEQEATRQLTALKDYNAKLKASGRSP